MKVLTEFEIPGLPKNINAMGYAHWTKRLKEARRWKGLVLTQCVRLRIDGLMLSKCTLVLTRHSSKESDFDNLASSFKHVIDGLKVARTIVDDKPSIIGSPTFEWKLTKQGEGKITIKILVDDTYPENMYTNEWL